MELGWGRSFSGENGEMREKLGEAGEEIRN
jgi:hypothetical protein